MYVKKTGSLFCSRNVLFSSRSFQVKFSFQLVRCSQFISDLDFNLKRSQFNSTDIWEVTWLLLGPPALLHKRLLSAHLHAHARSIHVLAIAFSACSFEAICISVRLSVYYHGAESLRRRWGCLIFRLTSLALLGSSTPLPHSNSSCTKWGTDLCMM